MTSGALKELSLRDALQRAHSVSDLALDTETQFPPILRMMLAVLHRSLDGPGDDAQWREWWNVEALPAGQISGYLDRWQHRFELFAGEVNLETSPFMQVPNLQALSGDAKTSALLVPHAASGNNVPLFSSARDANPDPLTPAQAARWLLHAHAWDTAGIKTGAVGDPRTDKGKTMGNQIGSLGQLGVVMPIGVTLKQTLLLNLLSLADREVLSPKGDLPVWEAPPLTARWSPRPPSGILDLYTWPSRRIRLIPDQTPDGSTVVRHLVLAAGDRFESGGRELRSWQQREPHSAWKRSSNLEKKHKYPLVYWPIQHQVERSLWRGLGPLLDQAQATSARHVARDEIRRPEVLAQLGGAGRRRALRGVPLRLRAVGVKYGNQSAVVDEVYSDTLPMPIAVLSAENRHWRDAVLQAVEAAGAVAFALGRLAANIAYAGGCDDDKLLTGHHGLSQQLAFFEFDGPFRRWIAELPEDRDALGAALDAWADEVLRIAQRLANQLYLEASPTAFRGRDRTTGDRTDHIDSPRALTWFDAAANKALAPLRLPEDDVPPAADEGDQ